VLVILGRYVLTRPKGCGPTTSMYARPRCAYFRDLLGVNAKIDSLSQVSELAGIAEVCDGVYGP
jgi:hypothetical protein